MYLFGSKLIKKHFSDFREPNDTDWVTNDQSKLKPSKIGEEEYYYIPNSPDREMTPNEIYTVKVSHAIYDIHWKKTMSDIRFLQIKGCKIIPDFLKSLRTHWELIHGVQVRTDFEVEPGNFFEDRVRRKLEITTLLEKGQSMPNFISNIHLSIISKIRNKKDKFNFRKMKINNREFRIRKKQFIDGVVSKIKSNDYLYPVIDGINKSSPFPGKVFFMKNDYSDKKPKLIMNGSGYLCPSYDNTGNYFLSDNMIYIHLDNQDQFENLKYIIKSKIVKYWLCQFRLNGFSDAKNIINFPYIPYNNKITEKNIYKYFNLTDEEIKLIEDTIKN